MTDVVVYSHKAEDGFVSFEEAVQTLRARADGCDVSTPLVATRSDDGVPAEYGRGGFGYGSGDSGVSRDTPSTKSGMTPPSSDAAAGEASYDSDARSEESFDSSESSRSR